MYNIKKIIPLSIGLSITPFVTFAAESCKAPETKFDTLSHMLNWASCTLIAYVVPLLFSLAVTAFIWGIIQFFLNPDNEEKRKKGKSFMIWGIIALFVMVSMWGLVGVLTKTFGIQTLIPQLSQ
jgi:hypothetical protein